MSATLISPSQVDVLEVRRSFAAFIGEKEYRRFVRTLNTVCRQKRRLLFWQQQLWRAFLEKHSHDAPIRESPLGELDFDAISEVFYICDVHGESLKKGESPVVYGLVYFSEDFLHARESAFPFANKIVYRGCCDGGEEYAEVDYCNKCRSELDRWDKEHS